MIFNTFSWSNSSPFLVLSVYGNFTLYRICNLIYCSCWSVIWSSVGKKSFARKYDFFLSSLGGVHFIFDHKLRTSCLAGEDESTEMISPCYSACNLTHGWVYTNGTAASLSPNISYPVIPNLIISSIYYTPAVPMPTGTYLYISGSSKIV